MAGLEDEKGEGEGAVELDGVDVKAAKGFEGADVTGALFETELFENMAAKGFGDCEGWKGFDGCEDVRGKVG